jgi:hypothetical protein
LCCPSPEGSPYDKARRTKVKRSHEIIAVVVAVMVGILVLAVGYYQQSSNLNEQGESNSATLKVPVEQGTRLPFALS